MTAVAENSVCNDWVICCTTLENRAEIGNPFSVNCLRSYKKCKLAENYTCQEGIKCIAVLLTLPLLMVAGIFVALYDFITEKLGEIMRWYRNDIENIF